MREIPAEKITAAIEELCIETNCVLNQDIKTALAQGAAAEESPAGRDVLDKLIQNAALAAEKQIPICQDTGMAIVFIDIGQEVQVVGGGIEEAIHEGVRRGYRKGYLRNSVVSDPLERKNTGDNTPAIIHYQIVEGDRIKILLGPKGFGSENMSRLYMLKPSDGVEGVKAAVVETVSTAGANPCPPIVVGVGLGGSMDMAARLAKRALLRPIDQRHPKQYYADLEKELLSQINKLGIGPAGLGGRITALAVNIETYPTHIAGLPLAININCHATRHGEATI